MPLPWPRMFVFSVSRDFVLQRGSFVCLHLEFNVRLVSRFHIAGVPSSVEVFVFFSHPVKRSLHCHADLCLIYIHDMQEFAGVNLHKLAVSATERGKAEDQREGE